MSNNLDPDQDRHFVGPDLGPTVCKGYHQKTIVAACKERVKIKESTKERVSNKERFKSESLDFLLFLGSAVAQR